MSERDPEQVRRAIEQAAAMAQGLPEALQVAAFNRAFDAILGTAPPGAPPAPAAPVPPPAAPAGRPAPRRGAAAPPPAGDADRVSPLLADIDRTAHPEIASERPVLDLALLVLRAAADCGQEWLTAGEIARVLREKFRIPVPESSIRPTLGGAGRLVDRRRFGAAFEYQIMEPGERHLDSLNEATTDEQPSTPRRGRGRSRRAAKKTARRGPARPESTVRGETGEPETADENVGSSSNGAGPNAEGELEGADEQPGAERQRARRGGRVGPKRALEQLIDTGYFDEPRTIGQIIDHLQHRRALTFAQTDLSPALVRLLREDKLERERNAERQYEYRRPGRD